MLSFYIEINEVCTYPLALVVLLIALKGAGNYLLIRGLSLPQVCLNSSSYCYYWF